MRSGPRTFLMTRRVAVAATAVAVVSMLSLPVGAEPNFGAATYLTTLPGTGLINMPPYGSISCVSTTCTVVGGNQNSFGNEGGKAAIITDTSGTWSAPIGVTFPTDHVVPVSGDGFSDSLIKVACWSVGNCVAVGQYGVSKNFGTLAGDLTVPTPMVMTETSGTWSTATSLGLPTAADSLGGPTGLSCDSTGVCNVVGFYVTVDENSGATTYHGFFTNNVGGTWVSPTDTAAVSGSPSAVIPTGISCADSTDCVYTEVARYASTEKTFVTTETSGVWGTPTALSTPLGRVFNGLDVNCPTSTGCIVVGDASSSAANLDNNTHLVPAFSVEQSGTWSTVGQLPQPLLSPVTNGGIFQSISCSGSTMCEAVGAATLAPTGGYSIPMAATWNGTKWSSLGLFSAPLHAGSSPSTAGGFLSTSCTTTTSCQVVGLTGTGTVTSSNVPYFAISTGINPTKTPTTPSAPVGLKAVAVPKIATVTWLPPYSDGGASIGSFAVTVTSPGLAKKLCVTTTLSCKFTGIVKGHTYHVTIQSRNGIGFSKPSLAASFVGR